MSRLCGRWGVPLLVTLWAWRALAADGSRPEVEPLAPADGAVVGSRPVFQLACHGLDGASSRAPHLRIRIESQKVGGATIVHDQRRRRAGWTPGEAGTMLFRPPRPMADGWYEWSAEVWDGVDWSPGGRSVRFRIDTVPPGPVRNLRASGDPERRVVRLEWDPVTADAQGGAEYVAAYRVYRYPRPSDQRFVQAYEVGRTEDTRIELPYDLAGGEEGPWFLRVAAVDLAGNEAERPD